MSQKLQLNSPRQRFAANGLAAANPLALARMIRLRDPGGYLGNSAGRFMQNTKALSPLANILMNPMDLVTASPNALVQRVLTGIRSTLNPVVGVVRVVVALPVLSMWFLLAGCQTGISL
jgi:hypothetical protein